MHQNRFQRAKCLALSISAAFGLALLTGCNVGITNLTPGVLPENPSQIYTISTRITPKAVNVVEGSLSVRIIIDGQTFPMRASDLGNKIYDFDYQLPAGRTEIAYYFLVNYQYEQQGAIRDGEEFTEVIRAKIVGRYVLSLETNRGPVGARISVLGRGFTAQDTVSFEGTSARTVFDSPTSISFFVPAVESGRNYRVELMSANGSSPIGTFRVDSTALTVSPSELTLIRGQTETITFTLPNAAPTGGLLLDVTTDVPESVIMPEVVVPAGSTSAIINVKGGKPGSGSLFLKGFGTGEVTIPVTVK